MKIRKGSRSEIPFLVTSILLLGLVFSFTSQALAGLNLEVPLEMVAHGLEGVGDGTGTTNHNRSRIFLDPADYDGATYYFEIVAKNTDSVNRNVYLRRTTGGAAYHATITVGAGTANFTRYRVALSAAPAAGKQQYLVRVTDTTSAAQLVVSTARVIVQQTNATKTRIQIPLVEKNHDISQVGSGRADTTTSNVYTQGDPDKYSLWIKDSSKYADISGWALEAVLDNNSATATTYAALHRASDGAIVADSEVSLYGSTIALVDTSFSEPAANFTDGNKFELKIKSSVSGQKAHLGRASLYVSLTNLSKAEVLYRVSRKVPSGPQDVVEQRTLLDTTLFTNPTVYFEATGRCADNGDRVFLRDHDSSVSGTGGANVSGSGINFNSATRDIVRTAAITPDSGDNFYTWVDSHTNTLKVTHAWVAVTFPTVACPTPGTPGTPSPADGVTNVSVDANLSWTCTGADSYDVYFGESSNPPFVGTTAGTTYTLPTNEYCTKYYWKIRAKNVAGGGCTTTGDIWDFTTEDGPPGTPGSPDPADLETGVSVSAILDWSDSTSTDTYDLYLGTSYPPGLYASDLTDSTYDPDLDWDTHYYWQIKAKNSCGSSTDGDVWEFTTVPEPAAGHFVDADNPTPGNPYDSWSNAANTIGQAIGVASAGETVMVRAAGTPYSEKVWMKDGVDLVAEEGVSPTITASPGMFNGVVEFTGPMTCNLTGFTIIYTSMGQGIAVDGSTGQVNATIDSCTVRNGNNYGVAIKLKGTVNITITGCDVYNNPGSMRVGIGGSGWGSGDRIASGSSITIKGTTIGGSGQGLSTDGIRLRGATSASNIQVTIGGSNVGDGNTISYNGRAGILLADIDQFSIENNDISSNGSYGAAGILIVDSSTASPHIKNNSIHHHVNAAGINIGGASNVTIGDNNNIYANKAGISFYVKNNTPLYGGQMDPITKSVSSQPVTITGNNIFSNTYAGIAIRDGISGALTITQNNIYSNTRGAIRMQRKCTLNISRNTIRDNLRGGIHTGSDAVDGGGFIAGQIGQGLLTIEKNKIYDNGQGGMGGGIDVRHMPGTIYNNLIYGNHRGGIRFGDYISEIVNNTVVYNGENDFGAGIAYDDLAGAVNDSPAGVPALPLLIRNNISAYNVKAGIRACFNNTEGSEERDYNLLYANYPWNSVFSRPNSEDCGWPTLDDMSCIKQQYGGCVAYFVKGVGILLDDPNDIVADPLFKDVAGDDYRLQRVSEGDGSDSPAINAGDDNLDMGAYGGSDPIDW